MSFANNNTETQDSEQLDQKMVKVETDFGESFLVKLLPDGQSDSWASTCKNKDIKENIALDSIQTKKENEMNFGTVPDSRHVTSKKIKVEDAELEEELPSVSGINKECDNFKLFTQIKTEKHSESEDKSNVLKGNICGTIPEVSYISVGEIKIEDGFCHKTNAASETESSDIEIQKPNSDCIDIATVSDRKSISDIYGNDSGDVDMSSEEDLSSSAVSKWNEEDDIPTISPKIKKEKTKLKPKRGKDLKIKEETNIESDSDQEDIPTDEEEEFLSDVSGGEGLLSDGDENCPDNRNLTVDNKPIVTHLIEEYHKRPQLWYKELSTEMSNLKELQLFRSINNALSKTCNMKFNVRKTKTLLETLCTQYEAEIERQLKENEETTAETSSLWFYDKLFFLKDDIEHNIKLKLENTLEVLDDNILADLIEIYKNFDSLWDTNNSSFPNKKKRQETMQSMCIEIKNKLKISLNTFKLEYQLINLHKRLKEDKHRRFTCEKKKQQYKSSLSFFSKCDFLESHQEPFKCGYCAKVLATYHEFRQHKARHDGTPPFQCNICGVVYKSKNTFDQHYYCHNGLHYNCRICGKEFSEPKNLNEHIKVLHMPVLDGKMFHCDICGKNFDRSSKVEIHKKRVHEEKPIECKTCGKICKNKFSFRAHKTIHGGKNYACDICEKKFNRLYNLNQHMELVHTFKCEICGEVCSNKEILKYHIASHEGKLFNCNICGKGFDDAKKVRYHELRTHATKEMECKICGKIFRNSAQLRYHSFQHKSGKKPNCSICGKLFVHPHSIVNHMQTHIKKYKCSFCGNKYALSYALKKHENVCKAHKN